MHTCPHLRLHLHNTHTPPRARSLAQHLCVLAHSDTKVGDVLFQTRKPRLADPGHAGLEKTSPWELGPTRHAALDSGLILTHPGRGWEWR